MATVRTTKFTSKFIRTGGGVTFEERGVQPSDFTESRGYSYAAEWAEDQEEFNRKYPSWQLFADAFSMRRPVIRISGSQKCETADFRASELERYRNPETVTVRDFAVPGIDRSSIPNGPYHLESLDFKDNGDTYTIVNVNYIHYGDWSLVPLSTELPDPEEGVGA